MSATELEVVDLTPEAFSPFGTVGVPLGDGAHGRGDVALDLSQGGPRFYIMRQEGRGLLRKPITAVAFCCAPATSGYAAAPARTVMRFRRLIPSPSFRRWAWIMALQSHFRKAGRMATFHPHEPIEVAAANDGKGAGSAVRVTRIERRLSCTMPALVPACQI